MASLAVRRLLAQHEGGIRLRAALPQDDRDPLHLRRALLDLVQPVLHGESVWTNWIGDQAASGLARVRPGSLDELVAAIGHAVRHGMSVRAVGAGHSTSSAARPDDLLIDMSALSGAHPPRWLRPEVDRDHHRRVLGGTRVKTLNRKLLDDLALPNMGSFDWQTVAGALSTGTHGSSVHTGPMAEGVRSLDLVVVERVDGEPRPRAYRIEPNGGITDPAAFRRARAAHGMELIQDDDVFYSSVVSFNAVGVIYAMTLELVDSFWLQEETFVRRWSDLRPLLAPEPAPGFDTPIPPLVARNDFVEFLVSGIDIQLSRARDPLCLIRRRNKRVPPRSRPDALDSEAHWPPRRARPDPLRALGRFLAEEALPVPTVELDPDTSLGGRLVTGLADAIEREFGAQASEPPFEGGLDQSVSHMVLRRERDDTGPEEEPDPPPEAISNEIAVPLDRTVEAVDDVLSVMRASAHLYPVPFGVRFVAPSPHYLAPQHGRFTTMIEVPLMLPRARQRREQLMPAYKQALERLEVALCYAAGAVGGRPHWGQYHILDGDRLRQIGYPHLSRFEAVRRRFDPVGTFQNRNTRQLQMEN